MSHQLRMLKTKKRLSSNSFYSSQMLLAVISLLVVVTFAFRLVAISWNFGSVELSIPTLDINDNRSSALPNKPHVSIIDEQTITIMLGPHRLILGAVSSFAGASTNKIKKVAFNHVNGRPQIDKLLIAIKKMPLRNKQHINAILVPDGNWPVAMLIEVVNRLRVIGLFKNIVLSTGLI